MNNERGFVLPVVMVIVALLSMLFLFASNEWSKWRQQEQLHLAMIQANHAAESGIAFRLQSLQANKNDYQTEQRRLGAYYVTTTVSEPTPAVLHVQSIAKGADDVQQTVTAKVEKDTLRIIAWLE